MNAESPVHDARMARSRNETKRILVIDEDAGFAARLARGLEQRGYEIQVAGTYADAERLIQASPPARALVDLRLSGGNGLDLVELIHQRRPDAVTVVLTAYGNIATAVAAVKIGAADYLCKPSSVDEVLGALTQTSENRPLPPDNPMSADRVRWEHIQRVFELYGHNVSETARRLSMHRRTLQRILAKNAPR
ncbi:ActR/PrrA/RegA family redox response regulator transcription factor [Aureimonas frigidaquae]|uniref:Photosynthetic apparatus regulatory protein RegA n=1 Tax=Aureimonas frigidaquae TaxID=424757 RepID=A0A0P0Z0U4_9HYPH|nr:ActR/PrrA/RegA family redox response regulator transcription factor [Aureimonas frigidaquae]BAT27651.1 photosynthetic apparatus regulatory protein RegA [Aureimonas frigidaquae]